MLPCTTWSEMSSDSITLTESEIEFLKYKFDTNNPDLAVELFVEMLVYEGFNPMNLKEHIQKMILRHQC